MEDRFVIDLNEVPEHEGAWSFALSRDWAVAAFEGSEVAAGVGDGRLEVQVTQAGKDYLVQGRLHIGFEATCARCLGPIPVEIDSPIAALFVPGPLAVREPTKPTDEEPEPDDGPDVEHYQGQRLVLDAYVRDTILLEVPMNPRCAVDCRLPERPHGES